MSSSDLTVCAPCATCASIQSYRCGENMVDHRAMSRASEIRQQLKRYVARLEKRNSSGINAAPDGNGIIRERGVRSIKSETTSPFQRCDGNERQGEPLQKAFVSVSRKHRHLQLLFNAWCVVLCINTISVLRGSSLMLRDSALMANTGPYVVMLL